jgi:phosphoribosylglycinamide formyltransferase-1
LGSTRGTDLQAIIDAIKNKKLDASIEIVISNKADAYILERARNYKIPALFIEQKGKTREEFDREVMKVLDEKNVDLVLLIGYMRFISKEFVDKWRNRVMNVHPSLLPKFAGGMDKNVHQAVLDCGEKETGMTIHFVDEGADSGPIILQKKCKIDENETVDSLKEKVQKLEGEGFIEAIRFYAEGKIKVERNKVIIIK